jgi:hypothetical protein
VANILDILFFFLFFLPLLFKATEGDVVGFQIFAWAPKKNNKNSRKNIKFGKFQKLSYCSKSLDMTFEGLGEMFEGDSADTCDG